MVAVGALLLLGGGSAAWLSGSEVAPRGQSVGPEPAASSVTRSAASASSARPASPQQQAWRAKRDRIREAWIARRPIPHDPQPDEPGGCSDECWGTLELQIRLAGAVEGCRELLPPGVEGQARFRATVIAEPELGAVVEAVDVLDDGIGVAEFSECIAESALLAELAEPTSPVSDEFVFRYRAGPPGDNAADFLAAHPELVEQYPRLAALLDRPLDAPRSDDDATAFATILSSDEAALSAFGRWSTEQGIDLSNVRSDDP